MKEILSDLQPEELEPRLELLVLVDPLAALGFAAGDNNCRDGGTCNINEA